MTVAEIDRDKLQYVVKLVISGNFFEWLEFEISPKIQARTSRAIKWKTREERIAEYIESGENIKNHRVTKRKIERLIRCNPHLVKFLTLTFEKNITDIDLANSLFHNFVARIVRIYNLFQYVCIPEFQKRGAVHYHLLCNLPFIENDDIAKIWQHGFTKINKIEQVKNISSYMTKYVTKEIFDGRMFGKKKFFCSQTLNRPQVYFDHDAVSTICRIKNLEQTYERKFHSYFGEAIYRLYQSPDEPNFIKINPNKEIS